MKTKFVITFILLLLVFLFTTCEKTISDFELKQHPPELVLKGMFYKDSITTINLSSTVSIDENSSRIPVIDGALVYLYENGTLIDRMQTQGNGDYKLDHYPLPGARYRIEVEYPGFKSIHAEMTMPAALAIDEVKSKTLLNQQDPDCFGCTPFNAMEITLHPSNTSDNQYIFVSSVFEGIYEIDCLVSQCVLLVHPEYGYEYDSCYCVEADTFGIRSQNAYINSRDARIDFTGSYNDDLWLADEKYEASGHELYLEIGDNASSWPVSFNINEYEIYNNEIGEVKVIAGAFSAEAYQFMFSLARAGEVEYNPLAEKVSLYSNVVNGKGVFGGAALETYNIKIDPVFFDSHYAAH